MKYTISSAKNRLTRNGLKFEGLKITGQQPGIKLWGALDFLVHKQGFRFHPELPKKFKEKVLSNVRGRV